MRPNAPFRDFPYKSELLGLTLYGLRMYFFRDLPCRGDYIRDSLAGLTEVQVTSVEDAKLLARYGQHNRHMGSTLLNQCSSRSHCIFTVKLIRLADTYRPRHAVINRCVREGEGV